MDGLALANLDIGFERFQYCPAGSKKASSHDLYAGLP